MNFLMVSSKFSDLNFSKSVILKIPYEQTTSYGHGCAKGPDALVEASAYVELFDEEFYVKPHTLGVSTQRVPDLDREHEENLKIIGKSFMKFYEKDKFVVSIGGEHSVTIGLVQALAKKEKNFSVIQFDAHADLRNYFLGSYNNHACVMRRVIESATSVYQLGIRSISSSEFSFIKKKKLKPLLARDMIKMDTKTIITELLKATEKKVYITFDVDYFSYDVIQDTGTPEPGGIGWFKTLEILRGIFENKDVLAVDIVELIGREGGESSAFNAALLAKKMITYKFFAKKTN